MFLNGAGSVFLPTDYNVTEVGRYSGAGRPMHQTGPDVSQNCINVKKKGDIAKSSTFLLTLAHSATKPRKLDWSRIIDIDPHFLNP